VHDDSFGSASKSGNVPLKRAPAMLSCASEAHDDSSVGRVPLSFVSWRYSRVSFVALPIAGLSVPDSRLFSWSSSCVSFDRSKYAAEIVPVSKTPLKHGVRLLAAAGNADGHLVRCRTAQTAAV
jgi:hypothetical protein